MVMSSVAFACRGLRCFQIGLQTCKSLLRAREIAGLQGADQTLIVRIRLAIIAKRLISRRLRLTRQVLLECG